MAGRSPFVHRLDFRLFRLFAGRRPRRIISDRAELTSCKIQQLPLTEVDSNSSAPTPCNAAAIPNNYPHDFHTSRAEWQNVLYLLSMMFEKIAKKNFPHDAFSFCRMLSSVLNVALQSVNNLISNIGLRNCLLPVYFILQRA